MQEIFSQPSITQNESALVHVHRYLPDALASPAVAKVSGLPTLLNTYRTAIDTESGIGTRTAYQQTVYLVARLAFSGTFDRLLLYTGKKRVDLPSLPGSGSISCSIPRGY